MLSKKEKFCYQKGFDKPDLNLFYCVTHGQYNKAIDCFADSGGPLMYLSNNRWTLYGLVCYVNGDTCEYTAPSFFTQVPKYLDWIRMAVFYLNNVL